MVLANTIALVANGAIDDPAIIKSEILNYERIIAVDGGLVSCDNMDIPPHLIIGDFDSISRDLQAKYSRIQTLRFPVEKDQTDLELALREVFKPHIIKITIFGALGKRVDHTLYNLHLLRHFPEKVLIETEDEIIFAIAKSTTIACQPGQTLSFIPLGGSVTGITTQGLKWELKEATFNKTFMSMSNISLTNEVQVSFSSGDLLCCINKTNLENLSQML
jgi:thiamine pyrophosphokinase